MKPHLHVNEKINNKLTSVVVTALECTKNGFSLSFLVVMPVVYEALFLFR